MNNTNEINNRIFELKNEDYGTWNQIASLVNDEFGITGYDDRLSGNACRKRYYRANEPGLVSIETVTSKNVYQDKSNRFTEEVTSEVPLTIEEFMTLKKIDPNKWEAFNIKSSMWDVTGKDENGDWDTHTNHSMKADFKLRKDTFMESKLLDVLADIKNISPYQSKNKYSPKGKHLFIPCLFDAHIGKPSDENIENLYSDAINALVQKTQRSGYDIDHIVFPVGNDLLNFDGLDRKTTAGTLVSSDLSMYEAIDIACRVVIRAVELLSATAFTQIVMVSGNHDRLATYWLGKVLDSYFTNNKNVIVDTNSDTRKYVLWNNVLLGFAHGDGEKRKDLPSLMAVEQPKLWGKSKYREWLTGHLHTQNMMYHAITETHGVTSRIIPALCGADDWHKMKGFIGNQRVAEGFVWGERGFEDQLGINLD